MSKITDWEDSLLQVSLNTPKWAAEQILERNQEALDRLENFPESITLSEVNIGCPHCCNCKSCLFTLAYLNIFNEFRTGACLLFKFGRYTHEQVDLISYTSHSVHVSSPLFGKKKQIKRARNFLTAHIKWAKRMLDGTYKKFVSNLCTEYLVETTDILSEVFQNHKVILAEPLL